MTFDAALPSASSSLGVFFSLIAESGGVSYISVMPRQTLVDLHSTMWSCSVYCHVESIGNLTRERRRVCVSGSVSFRPEPSAGDF